MIKKPLTLNYRIALLAIATLTIISSCVKQTDKLSYTVSPKTDSFVSIINVANIDSIDLPMIASTKSISLHDSLLLMETDGDDWFAYLYNINRNSIVDSIAKRGQGPDEFVSAAVSIIGEDSLLIVDNAKMSWVLLHNGEGVASGHTVETALNSIKAVSFPIICYIDYKPECSKLMLYDLLKDNVNDSITISNISRDGVEINSDFTQDYNSCNNTLSLAFYDENKIMIGSVENNKFYNISVYDEAVLPNRIHYTDIKVASDRVLALSQKNVDIDSMTGYSEIEVFDLNCNPICLLRLPSIYMNFDYDESTDLIVLQSALYDYLYFFTVNI